jgi:hypothetical protein
VVIVKRGNLVLSDRSNQAICRLQAILIVVFDTGNSAIAEVPIS